MDRKLTKIALFSKWNAADGTSILAELIGRELAKKYDLTVFAPINDVKPVQGVTDEDYVINNSKEKVAQEYIKLFKKLMRDRN